MTRLDIQLSITSEVSINAGVRLPGTPGPMTYWKAPDGIRLAGDQWGNPEAPLVILLHGGGQTRHAWKKTGSNLAEGGYFAVAPDMRGHGDSDWSPEARYGADALVQDIRSIIAQLEKTRAILVGASKGGSIALRAVGQAHIDAAALVLVDIAPKVDEGSISKIFDFMGSHAGGFDKLEDVAAAISKFQPHRKSTGSLQGLAKNVRLGLDGKYRWHWDPRYGEIIKDRSDRQQVLEECARNLSIPTLLVRGGLSDVLSEEDARRFLGLCPHAEYVSITNAAHMVVGDRNDRFGKAVVEFLGRVVPV